MGLLGNFDLSTGSDLGDLGLIGGLLGARQGQPWQQMLMQAAQAKEAARMRALQEQQLQQQLALGGIDLKSKTQAYEDTNKARDILRGLGGQQSPDAPEAPVAPPMRPLPMPGGGMGAAAQPPSPGGQAPAVTGSGKNMTFAYYSSLAQKMMQNGLPDQAQKYLDLAEKFRPKLKDTKTLTDPNSGQRVTVNFYEDGTREVVPFGPDQEKAHFADTGGSVQALDPFTGRPIGQGIAKTLSPDTQFTGGVTMRGQNMTDSRQRELNAITKEGNNQRVLETANGPVQIDLRTGTAAPIIDRTAGRAIPGEAQIKREANAKGVLDLLGDAKQLIPSSTNSLVGAGVDVGARGIGVATEGAKNIAALKTIEGALLAQMPRMEGPQSNYDVQNYKQAAGMLGDPTVPRALKMAAIAEIEKIQKRYASTAPRAQSSGGFRVLGRE